MSDQVQNIKQRFGIIGNNPGLNRALEKAVQIGPTDISVLVSGESGVGKEFIPKIIHSLSARKHNSYIAVNCGAIPEGTIDSELFGHEKGAFTGATQTRKGYFEVTDGGTIFLDEVGELPMHTQVRLLRVLESGEFLKVGSSNIQKTDVRIVAATNVKLREAIEKGKFREDLYYRLSTVQIDLPPLRHRAEDINLLLRKFLRDFSDKYRTPALRVLPEALQYIEHYPWPGNIRQLRNFAEEIAVIEANKDLDLEKVRQYLPPINHLPAVVESSSNSNNSSGAESSTEREILYKFLLDMKKDLNDLRSLTLELINKGSNNVVRENSELVRRVFKEYDGMEMVGSKSISFSPEPEVYQEPQETEVYEEITEEPKNNSLQESEKALIKKVLEKHRGKRRAASNELGISERTLYRKIKQYDL